MFFFRLFEIYPLWGQLIDKSYKELQKHDKVSNQPYCSKYINVSKRKAWKKGT